MSNLPRTTVALFAYGGIAAECLNSHLATIAAIIAHKLPVEWFAVREDALISRSRCRATGIFLAQKNPTDVLIMLDHDIEFNPVDLWHLAELAKEHDAIVGVPYSKRALGATSACRPAAIQMGDHALQEVEYVASGFMAIPRSALNRILDRCLDPNEEQLHWRYRVEWCKDNDKKFAHQFPSVWQPFVHNGEYLSEDYAFCERAKQAGVKVFAWTKPLLKHWGMHGFTLPVVAVNPPDQKCEEMKENARLIIPAR